MTQRSRLAEGFIGFMYAVAFVATLLAILALQGCATTDVARLGIQMDDDERAACALLTCSVWTMEELREFYQRAFLEGYQQGAAGRRRNGGGV